MQPNTISSTARLIAKATILNAHDTHTKHLVTREAGRLSQVLLNGSTWIDRNFTSLVKVPGFSTVLFALERFIKPGLCAHYALRKRYIENLLCERLERDEYRQVVIFGCGFDTFVLRQHHRYPTVQFFEIDTPALIAQKRSALSETGSDIQDVNVHLFATDSRESIGALLGRLPGFKTTCPTLLVIEGVLMYLQQDEVTRLFRDVVALGENTEVIFTFLQPLGAYAREERPLAEKLADVWLSRKGEPYRWSVTEVELESLCREVGLKLEGVCLSEGAAARAWLEAVLPTRRDPSPR